MENESEHLQPKRQEPDAKDRDPTPGPYRSGSMRHRGAAENGYRYAHEFEYDGDRRVEYAGPRRDTGPSSRRRRRPHSSRPVVGGSLLIIAGIFGILMGTMVLVGGSIADDIVEEGIFAEDAATVITGTVVDHGGAPIANATVTVKDTTLRVITNETGAYLLVGVPYGPQEFVVEHAGYRTLHYRTMVFDDMEISAKNGGDHRDVHVNGDTSYNFTLYEGSGSITRGTAFDIGTMFGVIWFFGALGLALGGTALVAGIFALKQKHRWLAIIGAMAGFFAVGFFVGAVLAIIALFFILLGHDEFRSREDTRASAA